MANGVDMVRIKVTDVDGTSETRRVSLTVALVISARDEFEAMQWLLATLDTDETRRVGEE